jgi:hypothetical protein
MNEYNDLTAVSRYPFRYHNGERCVHCYLIAIGRLQIHTTIGQ